MATVQKHIPRSLTRLVAKFDEHRKLATARAEAVVYRAIRSSIRRRTYKTGFFYNSVEVRSKEFVSFTTSEFYSNCLYAGFLERGTRFMTARRPMTLGLLEGKAQLERELQDQFGLFTKAIGS